MPFDDPQSSAVSGILAAQTPQITPQQQAKQQGFARALRGQTPIQQGTTPIQQMMAQQPGPQPMSSNLQPDY